MLAIKDVSLSYGNSEEVLHNLSFDVQKGECILFTGKSGSGKSSIINTINGLSTRYDNGQLKGEILFMGKSLGELELYQISMLITSVFQNPKTHFFNVNTTLELLFYLENIGLSKEEMDRRLNKMLEVFPIQHLLNRDIFKLSGGEKQILCVAACYIAQTKVVVLDEPSSNLDECNIEILSKMLKILKASGITLLLCEHRIYYLMDLVDRIFLLQEGKFIGEYDRNEFNQLSMSTLYQLGIRDRMKSVLSVKEVHGKGNFEIKKIEAQFKGSREKLVLHDVSFMLGKIYGIVGVNGIGKSTLLRCLIGVNKQSVEEIYLDGKRLSQRERLKMSALVMQDVNHQLFTDSVLKEVGLGIKGVSQAKIEAILQQLELLAFKDRHPMSLSGGQKQRVAIASVICKEAKFIYFDEPTSGMDYTNMMNISTLIKQSRKADKIIFIVSHDVEFLNVTADQVLTLK